MSGKLAFLPDGHTGITFDGRTYRLDRLVDSPRLALSLPEFREAYREIPEEKWDEVDLIETFSPPVEYQVQNGCVGHGGETAFTMLWVASGYEVPPGGFSPTWAYALINKGIDQGAMIGDLIEALQTVGMATADVFPESKCMLGGPAEAAARPVAANCKLDDGYRISTWAELGTALSMGYPVPDSVMVGDDFPRLDADGFAPVHPGPGNHCVCAGGIRRFKGKVGIKHRNSWGRTFGLDGNFYTTKDHVLAQGWGFSGVVFRTVKPPPGVIAPVLAP